MLSADLPLNLRIIRLDHFYYGSSFFVACLCNHFHQKNQNRCSKMVLTSHLSYAYDDFSSCRVSFSFISILTKISLMKSLTMMVLGPGYLVCAFFIFDIFVDRVSGIFSVWIFSRSKQFLVSSSDF